MLTAAFLVCVVNAVVHAVAARPQWDAAIVCLAGEFSILVTLVIWTPWVRPQQRWEKYLQQRNLPCSVLTHLESFVSNELKHYCPSVQLTAGLKGLVGAVATVVLDVAHQVQWDAAFVGTLELGGRAGLHGASLRVLVTTICTVVNAVAVRGCWDAPLVLALELVIQAAMVTCGAGKAASSTVVHRHKDATFCPF